MASGALAGAALGDILFQKQVPAHALVLSATEQYLSNVIDNCYRIVIVSITYNVLRIGALPRSNEFEAFGPLDLIFKNLAFRHRKGAASWPAAVPVRTK